MAEKNTKSLIIFVSGSLIFLSLLISLSLVLYLKVLPWAVSNSYVLNYVEDVAEKSLNVNVDIQKPFVKTGLSPNISLGIKTLKLSDRANNSLLTIENFNTDLSLAEIFNKNILIKNVSLDYVFADVNKILDMPVFKQEKDNDKKSDWSVDIFQSVMSVKNAKFIYNLDKKTLVKVDSKNLKIDDNSDKKNVFYSVTADIQKEGKLLHVVTSDNNGVYINKKEKVVINNSPIIVNNSKILLNGYLDSSMNYDLNLASDNFKVENVIQLLDSQIVENNITQQLVYFNDIDGSFDFNIKATNKGLNGNINLDNASFKLVPFANLPILLNSGTVSFDSKDVKLKDFKGYYNNKPSNKMVFSGTVKDYLKSVDTHLSGDAVVTNDFAQNYLSKIVGYPMQIKGKADTRVVLKSKYNKIDLLWLYRFKKGNGFVTEGQESYMNNAANRVLAADMHFEDMILNIKSIDYYAWDKPKNKELAKIPLLSASANIDFSDGKTFVQDFGLELPKPMPSGFLNMLMKQKLFKNGTFMGKLKVVNTGKYGKTFVQDFGLELPKPMPSGFLNMLMKQKLFKNGTFMGKLKVVNTGKYPVIVADMKAEKVAIPSQRLFIREGRIKTENNNINITSEGRYRRSAYEASGTIVNEIKFPIVVKNITLALDTIDVEKYLKIFNNQTPSDAASSDVQAAIAQSVENNATDDEDADDEVQTFDLANLIIEECIFKVNNGC